MRAVEDNLHTHSLFLVTLTQRKSNKYLSTAMDIDSTAQDKARLFAGAWGRVKALPHKLKAKVTSTAKSIKKLGRDDPRRLTHSLKVGLALTLVSLLYYARPIYDGFGMSGMWAVLTVVVVFEFTVGKLP